MRVRAFIERERKWRTVEMKRGRTGDLLQKLGINQESVIVVKGKDLVADSPLRDGDRFRIIHIKATE